MEPACCIRVGGPDGWAGSCGNHIVTLVKEKNATSGGSTASTFSDARASRARAATARQSEAAAIAARQSHRPARALPLSRERQTKSRRNVERPRKNALAQARLDGSSAAAFRASQARWTKAPVPTN